MAFALGFLTRWAFTQIYNNVKRKLRGDRNER